MARKKPIKPEENPEPQNLSERGDVAGVSSTASTQQSGTRLNNLSAPLETTPIIHCYFEAADGVQYEPELRLVLEWIRRWETLGYTAKVLNEYQARKHPKFEQFMAKVMTFPSVNSSGPNGYEARCWQRYLAWSVADGGAHADYDTFPRTFTPLPVTDDLTIFEGEGPGNACPSLMSGTPEAIEQFVDYVLSLPDGFVAETVNGKPHTSDMLVVRSFPGLKVDTRVRQFGEPGFKEANFLHCCHAATVGKRPRWKFVGEMMEAK